MATPMARRASGEGSIFRDSKTGLWVATVRVTGGRRLTKRSKTKAAAVENKRVLLERSRALSSRPDPNRTVAETVRAFVAHELDTDRLAPSTVARHETYRDYIIDDLGSSKLTDLTTVDVERFLQRLSTRPLRPLGRDSLSKLRGLLKRAIDRAVARGDVDRNVAAFADLPHQTPRRRPSRQSLDRDNAYRFLASCAEHELGEMWHCQLRLCLRPGEVAALTWGSIDGNRITISRAARRTETGAVYISDELKTTGARRTITAPSDVIKLLEHRRSTTERSGAADLVFATANGRVIDPAWNRRALAVHCTEHGVHVTDEHGHRAPIPNELRHTGLSLLADQGAPNELLAQLAGHRSTRMVDEVYRHRIRPSVDTAINFDWLP